MLGGAKGSRTPHLLDANQMLYQMSYGPNYGDALLHTVSLFIL